MKLIFETGTRIILGGQVSGARSAGELINAISACIHQRMTADDIATFQTGTHPGLTASPIAYQLVNAGGDGYREFLEKVDPLGATIVDGAHTRELVAKR